MVKNRHLARAISDAGWSEFRRMLEYKGQWYGSEVVIADRWFASSKRCSGCGEVKASLTLADRTFRCDCGLVVGRDVNAARNLSLYPQLMGGAAT